MYPKKTVFKLEYTKKGEKKNITTEDKEQLNSYIEKMKSKGIEINKVTWWLAIDITKDYEEEGENDNKNNKMQ